MLTLDLNWLAYFECADEEVADAVYNFFKERSPYTMSSGEMPAIMACEVQQEDLFITVFFNGDPLTGYSVFLQWTEQVIPNQVALIQVTHADLYPSHDRMDCRLLQLARHAVNKSPYYYDQEVALIKAFMSKVILGNYTREQLARIVRACRIGEDTCNAEALAYRFVLNWLPDDKLKKDRIPHWQNAIQCCHTTGRKERDWVDGDNLLVRVLAHLLYLEELYPTPFVERVKRWNKGVQKMSLT